MKSILMLYMTGHLLMSENWATSTLHIFVGMVYLLPVAGAWLADKVWGRYKTILYISLLYCVGHGVLATADLFQTIEARRYILMAGLLIIALGGRRHQAVRFPPSWGPDSGQVPAADDQGVQRLYWAINLGSFFLLPGDPGHGTALRLQLGLCRAGHLHGDRHLRFLAGTPRIQQNTALTECKPRRLLAGALTVLFRGGWNKATLLCGENAVTDTRHILKILSIFAFVIPFWSIFDQTASSWVAQGNNMIPISIPLPGNMVHRPGGDTGSQSRFRDDFHPAHHRFRLSERGEARQNRLSGSARASP